MSARRRDGAVETLSTRQLEVAKLVAAGNSSRDIAEKLALSPRTIETHVAAIFAKLGIRSRSQLSAMLAPTHGGSQTGNLPASSHRLIGRTADVAAIAALVAKNALVTVLGTGGIGKTQASIRVAADAETDYADGVWLLELASLMSGDYIAPEIARVFDLSLSANDGDILPMLANQLKKKRALLVFDSCEHLIGPASAMIAAIVRACPGISVLATSRESLGISGEVTYRLPGLAPSDARALFIERTQSIDNRIVIDEEANRAIAEICRKLDGIPLAIELAAARTNVFSPVQLLRRLDSRFALLNGGRRDVLPRHQSMSALIDWSYDQLDGRERQLFRRLSIFCSRFSLEAAFAISSIARDDEESFLNLLSSLIGKSLVATEAENGKLLYRLLDTNRIYARRKLEDYGESDDVARMHARYLTEVLESATARTKRWGSQEAIAFFTSALADLRAALAWALRANDIETGAELLVAIHYLWSVTSVREGIGLIDAYLARLDAKHGALRARLLAFLSEFHWRSGHQDRAFEAAARAVEIARASADEAALADALVACAVATTFSDRVASHEHLREAEALTNTTETTRHECRALRARLTFLSDDYELAIPMYRRLIDEAISVDDASDHAQCFLVLALIEHRAGRYETALDYGREAVARIREVNERWALALYSASLTALLVYAQNFVEAREVALATLTLYAEIDPESPRIATIAAALGYAFAVEGDLPLAANLTGTAMKILEQPGVIAQFARDLAGRCEAVLRDAMSEDEFASQRSQGAGLSVHDIIELVASRATS